MRLINSPSRMGELEMSGNQKSVNHTSDEYSARLAKRLESEESLYRATTCGIVTAAGIQFTQFFLLFLVGIGSRLGAMGFDEIVGLIICLIFSQFFYFGVVTLWLGLLSAWFSHWWFYGTKISVVVMTIVTTIIAEFVVVGWQLVILVRGL